MNQSDFFSWWPSALIILAGLLFWVNAVLSENYVVWVPIGAVFLIIGIGRIIRRPGPGV